MLIIIFLLICLQDMADYIAYVAKDLFNQRACHILECPQGGASEVINSIGQAFETRFRQLLSCPSIHCSCLNGEGEVSKHPDYYNVVPGKMPPHGGIEDLRLTRVCSAQTVSLYENCSITEETPAPPAGKNHQYTPEFKCVCVHVCNYYYVMYCVFV
uniref:PID domain-containing protein n=1 Tax=Dicentrarchus labrax TaxID=13489 RepID=A0A8C4F071_DICLA